MHSLGFSGEAAFREGGKCGWPKAPIPVGSQVYSTLTVVLTSRPPPLHPNPDLPSPQLFRATACSWDFI